MNVEINGAGVELTPRVTIREALRSIEVDPDQTGIAVAVNGRVVPRSGWDRTHVNDGDVIEVITAAQGG